MNQHCIHKTTILEAEIAKLLSKPVHDWTDGQLKTRCDNDTKSHQYEKQNNMNSIQFGPDGWTDGWIIQDARTSMRSTPFDLLVSHRYYQLNTLPRVDRPRASNQAIPHETKINAKVVLIKHDFLLVNAHATMYGRSAVSDGLTLVLSLCQ